MKAMWKTLIAASFAGAVLSNANAASVGDKVYVVFGSGRSAEVYGGTVIVAGDSRSKVDWDYYSYCEQWVLNHSMYYSRSAAQETANTMDAEYTSFGEAAGVAAGLGLLYLWLDSQ